MQFKPYQLDVSRAISKIEGVWISKSPVPKNLGTSLNTSRRRPWTQITEVEVDKVWCDKLCPTWEDFCTDDIFLRATPNLRAGLNLNNGLQQKFGKNQEKQLETRMTMCKPTPLEIRFIPLGGLCRTDSRSALSSSSERPVVVAADVVATDVDFGLVFTLVSFPLVWMEWTIPTLLPEVAELRDFMSVYTGWMSGELKTWDINWLRTSEWAESDSSG